MDPKERVESLTRILEEANYQYYVLDDPRMPDFEYDHLLRELEILEEENPALTRVDSPTKRVGGEALSKFEKVTHPVPLMSLQDVFSVEELDEFLEKIQTVYPDTEFTVEPKVDGLSVALEYENGIFVRGATRGDGNVGEDVTENLLFANLSLMLDKPPKYVLSTVYSFLSDCASPFFRNGFPHGAWTGDHIS